MTNDFKLTSIAHFFFLIKKKNMKYILNQLLQEIKEMRAENAALKAALAPPPTPPPARNTKNESLINSLMQQHHYLLQKHSALAPFFLQQLKSQNLWKG